MRSASPELTRIHIPPQEAEDEESDDELIDDLPGSAAPQNSGSAEVQLSAVDKILKRLFGHNAEKVKLIFESWTAYSLTFDAVYDEWPVEYTWEYKHERALRLYRSGGLAPLHAVSGVHSE